MNRAVRHIVTIFVLNVLISHSGSFLWASMLQNAYAAEDTAEVSKAFQLFNYIKAADRFVNWLDTSYAIDFPVGIVSRDKRDAEQYAIVIPEVKLRGGNTYLTAYMAFTVPGTTKKIAFRGMDIPFSFSGGLKRVAVMDLVSDFKVELTPAITLILKGAGKTRVRFDCYGFREMDIVADVMLDSAVFVPENPDGTRKNTALKTTIQTTITDWSDLLVAISLEPFQIKGLKGLGISITNAVLDLSDFRNPANITFSPVYFSDYFMQGNPNIWQGIYIQEAQIRLPQQFRKKQKSAENYVNTDSAAANRLTFYVQNLMIDELGFTGLIGASNLMTIDEGDLGGWAFSINDFSVDIQASQLVAAGFNGQINVPQFKQNTLFNYAAIIGMNDTYSFNVSITDTISMDMWTAKLKIEPNSALNILVTEKAFVPSLLLNGTLSVNSPFSKKDTASAKLALAKIPFQGMRIQTVEPYFSVDYISFGTEQNAFSKFPVSISEVGIVSEGNKTGLRLGLTVNFTGEKDGGFGGDGVFTVWGVKEDDNWKYDGLQVDRISVRIDKGDAFELHGEVVFIRGDNIYGNGFKGTLDAKFAGFGMQAMALFGNVNGYRYWFADAMVTLATGIPAGPVALYGFGGGAFYHIRQAGIDMPASEIGKSLSGILYAPDKNTGLGLKASVKFGLSAKKEAFNGDVEFGISFTSSGGIDQISFKGNAYFVTQKFTVNASDIMEKAKYIVNNTKGTVEIPKEAESSQLYGSVYMLFDFTNKCFHSTFDIYVNVAGGIIAGVGPGGRAGWGIMHFEPNDWYIHLGTPENPNGISVLNLATMTNYFMAGKSVPELPRPPAYVMESLRKNNAQYPEQRNTLALENGSGFALGGAFNFDTGERTFLIFYGRFGCGLGFDILMKDYGNVTCEGSNRTLGINGWYAQGQAYAWVAAAVGIKVDLPFYSGKYAIFEMDVAALMEAKGPNPFWMKGTVGGNYNILGGLVKGRCDFEFEIGQQCKIASSSPLGGMAAIAEIRPAEGEENVDVFATPQLIFNMPVGEVMEFRDENKNTKQYRIKLDYFKVTTADGNMISGTLTWNDRHDVLVFKPNNILPGETTIKAEARVSFEECKNGNWYAVLKNGKATMEDKVIRFTTGKEPDYIPQHNIAYSYPGYRAFNYYKSETAENYIKLNSGQPRLFNPGNQWVQRARLVPVSGGTPVWFNFSYDSPNNQINFSIPSTIANNTIYRLEIVHIPASSGNLLDANVKKQTETRRIEADGSSVNVDVTKQLAESSRSELQEKVIYSMEFRTSRYSTFTQKLNALEYSDGILYELYPLVHSITVNISGERFDDYEVINLSDQSMITCSPVLSETNWYTTYIEPYISLSQEELAEIGAPPFQVNKLTSYIFQADGTRRLTDEEIARGTTSDVNVISGMKNYISKLSCEYMYMLKNYIVNAYSTGNIPAGRLTSLHNANFRPLTYGNYPVNISYTLPGKSTPQQVKKHVISVID